MLHQRSDILSLHPLFLSYQPRQNSSSMLQAGKCLALLSQPNPNTLPCSAMSSCLLWLGLQDSLPLSRAKKTLLQLKWRELVLLIHCRDHVSRPITTKMFLEHEYCRVYFTTNPKGQLFTNSTTYALCTLESYLFSTWEFLLHPSYYFLLFLKPK